MKLSKNVKRLLVFTLTFQSVFILNAQRIQKWINKNSQNNYVHGTFRRPVSGSIKLISLYRNLDNFKRLDSLDIYFDFFYPEKEYYFLQVLERVTSISKGIAMESNPDSTNIGKTTFGPWETKFLSILRQVPPSNLTYLLRIGSDNSNHYLPLDVYRKKHTDKSTQNYKAIFRLGKSIRGGTLKVYKGYFTGIPDENFLVQTQLIGKNTGGSTFQVNIEIQNLDDYQGWLTIKMNVTSRTSLRAIPYDFFVFHKKNQTND